MSKVWLWCGIAVGVACVKTLPLVWHWRFFTALFDRWLRYRLIISSPQQILLPTIMISRSPPSECDFNIHKSNSTYFSDLDGARAHLSGLLFGPLFFGKTEIGRCNLIVSAVSCVFRKEIKPQQPYEMWTKVASWDDKWIYMVTHFVEKGRFQPRQYLMQGSKATDVSLQGPCQDAERAKAVLASAITRLVFKKGRLTISPQRAMEACGLMPPAHSTECGKIPPGSSTATDIGTEEKTWSLLEEDSRQLRLIEATRQDQLPVVQLQRGWDAVHELFSAETIALAVRKDFTW